MRKIYVDMDGTLCRFHDTEHQYIEAMWTQGFYINLKPFEELLNGLSVCIDRNPDAEFYILSAVLDTEPSFAEAEKREWLHKFLPQISDEHILFSPAGTDKSEYIGSISSDCCLIDDYNKNLKEWQAAGGTAIKFINDINNRGLGAYGGEKGALWSGMSIAYNQSSMDICLQIEQYAGIERTGEKANARYGFEGDVLPWDFANNILPYFELRSQIDNNLIERLSVTGETFESYSLSQKVDNDLFALPAVLKYMKEHKADKALIDCLEQCYSCCRLNNISTDKVSSWITASINLDNMWRTYPVTPSNVQMYITSMIDRDKHLQSLAHSIDSCAVSLKLTERQLYIPKANEVIDNYLLNGKKVQHLEASCAELKNQLNILKKDWFNTAKAEYPCIAYGNSQRRYTSYFKNQSLKFNK